MRRWFATLSCLPPSAWTTSSVRWLRPRRRTRGRSGGTTTRSSSGPPEVRAVAGLGAVGLHKGAELGDAAVQRLLPLQDHAGDLRVALRPCPRGPGAGEEVNVSAGAVRR